MAWLYSEYRAGQTRARVTGLQQRPVPPPLPPPGLLLPPGEPRIVFGQTYDPANLGNPAVLDVQPAPGSRTCPVCRRAIGAGDYPADRVIICPHCRTHAHVECWEYSSNRCPNCGQ